MSGRATGPRQVKEQPGITSHTGLAMVVVMTGVLITAVDTTIVVLALPEIERGLTWPSSVIWVVIGYLLVITLLATQVGRLGDMFGRVRMYEAGFLVFILGPLACALAWDESSIVGFRILQGIGGAFDDGQQRRRDRRPLPSRAAGQGLWLQLRRLEHRARSSGSCWAGLIVTYVSWRWIFWINVPIGAAALALATMVLHEQGHGHARHFDLLGMVTLGLGLFGVLWAMTRWPPPASTPRRPAT